MTADSNTAEELKQKKLKIWSSVISNRVVVAQDGDAADPDVSAGYKFDDAFVYGTGYGWGAEPSNLSAQRMAFDLVSLSSDQNGKDFVFEIQDYTAFNTLTLSPNDRVEFSAEVGEALSISGTWDSWHAASQAPGSQQILFYGFVDEVTRVINDRGERVFRIRCVDMIAWADKITGVQDIERGHDIPWLIFNVDSTKDVDWFISVKNYDAVEANPLLRWRTGNPITPVDAQMTLYEIFDYLQQHYKSAMFDRGMIDLASDDIFVDSEINIFTQVPQKSVFENQGLGSIIRTLIRNELPDHDVVIDPRTKKWHIRPVTHDILPNGGFSTISAELIDQTKWSVDDASKFSTSGDGSSVRLQSVTDFRLTEVRECKVVVTGGPETVEITQPVGPDFGSGDLMIPMYDIDKRPPTLLVDLLEDTTDHDLTVDLNGVYTAVSIVGRRAKFTRSTVTHTVPGGAGGAIMEAQIRAGYDPAYETNYVENMHSERRTDRGNAGEGIAIDEIQTIGVAPDEFTRIYFSESHSAYEDDHDVVNAGTGQAEWTGTAFHVLTKGGDSDDIELANVSAIIDSFAPAGWMDSPTNSIRRYRIDLDRNLLDEVATLQDEVNDADPDFFEMTSSEIHKPRNPNMRWAVGRIWQVVSTTLADDADDLNTTNGCPGQINFQNSMGLASPVSIASGFSQTASPISQMSEAPRTFEELVDFHNLNPSDPLNGGVPGAWFLKKPEPPPTFEELCAQLPPPPPPPRTFTLDLDRFEGNIHKARVPAAGFEGLAWYWHKHAEELFVTTDAYEHESQDTQFALLAQALWARVSQPHYRGRLNLNSLVKWLGLIDLGFRVRMGNGATGNVTGVVTEQNRFWGLCKSIQYNFQSGTTSLSFDSRGFADDLQVGLFEKRFISETAELKTIKDNLKSLQNQVQCEIVRPAVNSPYPTDGCNVAAGPISVSARIAPIDLKDGVTIGPRISISIPGTHTINQASVTGSHGFNPPWIIEEDYLGTPFAIANPSGAVAKVDMTLPDDSNGTISTSNPPDIVAIPQYLAEEADEFLQAGVLGGSIPVPAPGQLIEIDSGSTTTVLQLKYPIHNDGRYNSGYLHFAPDGKMEGRPRYKVLSHTATSITLTAAMSESIPSRGSVGMIRPTLRPTLDATDFPNGGKSFKDSNGDWFVATAGVLTKATLSAGVLSSTSGASTQDVGLAGHSFNPKGDWNFDGATSLKLKDESVDRDAVAEDMRAENYFSMKSKRLGTVTAGQLVVMLYDVTGGRNRRDIPAGKRLEVLSVHYHWRTPTTNGTYSARVGIQQYDDDASTTKSTAHYFNAGTENQLVVAGGVTMYGYHFKEWDGVTPLAGISGGDNKTFMLFFEAGAENPGTLPSANQIIEIVARLV